MLKQQMCTNDFADMTLLDKQSSSMSAERQVAETFRLTKVQHLDDTKQIILNTTFMKKKFRVSYEGTLGGIEVPILLDILCLRDTFTHLTDPIDWMGSS